MIFDARPDARLIFKERLLWLLFLAPFFFLVYGTTNQLTTLHEAVPSIMFDWEKSIPFIPEMIVPYMSLDLLFGFSFLLVKTRDEIQRHAMRLGFVIAFSALLFLLFPLQFSFEKPMVEGWTKAIFTGLAADLPYNQLPSLHVSLAMVVGYMYYTHLNGFWRWLSLVWFSLIAVSTLLVYQHHFIDLPSGFIAGLLIFYIIPVKGNSIIPVNFVSPKHLHIALYYLTMSIIFTLIAFKIKSLLLAVVCSWIAFSMFLIACLYVLGHNPITIKNKGKIMWFYYLIFWPYLLANNISWQIWKTKVASMVEVADGIWIGRKLEAKDKAIIHQNNIKTIIDLAPEVSDYFVRKTTNHYQPLLDLVIPDPLIVKQLTELITDVRKQGNVFIHCKFGLSRSVIVACAWLITQGYSRKNAWAIVSKAQPQRVDKPYLHIALELFEEALIKDKA